MRAMGSYTTIGALPRTFGLHHHDDGGDEQRVPLTRAKVGRVASYFGRYWAQWLVILICIALSSGLAVLPPLCVRGIIDDAIPKGDGRLLNLLVAAIVGITVASGLVGVLQNFLNARAAQAIMFDLRNQLYRHLQRQSLGFFSTTRAGEIVSRLNNDVGAVQETATNTVVSIASNVFTVVATAVVIFSMDPLLATLAVAIVPTFFIPTRLVGRIRRRLSRETQEQQAELVAFMEERLNIGGVVLAKTFGQGEADAELFSERNRRVMALNVRQAVAGRWLFMCLAVFSVAGPAAIYLYGGHQAIAGKLTVGTLIAFVAYLANLYRPVGQLANVYVALQGALAVFERVFEYLDRRPDVEDAPNAIALREARGEISLEDVSFEYPTAAGAARPAMPDQAEAGRWGEAAEDRRALRDVTLRIAAGERVALVGPSGAGKTTITYLLPRFYDPTAGRITLDGHDLRDITQESLRALIGVVTQDTFLFHASIRENLLYARPGATEEDLIAAARSANIHDFIAGLPHGYDSIVGERGFRLSGGEKQRLAIARALLKDPRILILDEATSHLDAASEALIQGAMDRLLQGRTAVIIAHRLSTVINADKIVVLDEGRVVECGTHEELLARGGLYASLYAKQFGPAAIATEPLTEG